ncbi:unnamed protein product [Adineta ricciae]|uniref:Uncharacterized protein n=1 Tax=Adineta ricciae TaxID=249248 RepID=A0A813W4L7_ADIRI|nr:unnamed protein product [Adineta ricciae]CAF1169968.1 unnamed protein product [Adineta ricciae]
MFWLAILSVIFGRLLMTNSSLVCRSPILNQSCFSLESLNTTHYESNLNSSGVCTTELIFDYNPDCVKVQFGDERSDYANKSKDKITIHHMVDIRIYPASTEIKRNITLYCPRNDSCSEDAKNIYEASMKLNRTKLLQELGNELLSASDDNSHLTCSNNNDQEIFCSLGCCSVQSDGKSGFIHSCERTSCNRTVKVAIRAQAICPGDDSEATFSYTCDKPMCNNKFTANKLRRLLKDASLLTQTGTSYVLCSSAASALSQISIIIKYLSIVIAIILFNY